MQEAVDSIRCQRLGRHGIVNLTDRDGHVISRYHAAINNLFIPRRNPAHADARQTVSLGHGSCRHNVVVTEREQGRREFRVGGGYSVENRSVDFIGVYDD